MALSCWGFILKYGLSRRVRSLLRLRPSAWGSMVTGSVGWCHHCVPAGAQCGLTLWCHILSVSSRLWPTARHWCMLGAESRACWEPDQGLRAELWVQTFYITSQTGWLPWLRLDGAGRLWTHPQSVVVHGPDATGEVIGRRQQVRALTHKHLHQFDHLHTHNNTKCEACRGEALQRCRTRCWWFQRCCRSALLWVHNDLSINKQRRLWTYF